MLVYYHIWIRALFGAIAARSTSASDTFASSLAKRLRTHLFDDEFDSLVLHSFSVPRTKYEPDADLEGTYSEEIQEASCAQNQNVFVRREHLEEKHFWKYWAFASLVLMNEITLTRFEKDGAVKTRLEVDLHDQCYGIYNNCGKHFLKTEFSNASCFEISEQINRYLRSNKLSNVLKIGGHRTPFRWASGGVLPIVRWKGRDWYALFFRGIGPVGWNIANGASESVEEHTNLRSLIYREFFEELIVLSSEPENSSRTSSSQDYQPAPTEQKIFMAPDHVQENTSEWAKNHEFAVKHAALRNDHDNIRLIPVKGPQILQIPTPFELRVTSYNKMRDASVTFDIPNIIFSVNPCEMGIEIIYIVRFEMQDADYLLDGEIWELGPSLVRQPVGLISVDYLKSVFEKNNGSLGVLLRESPHLDCKRLEELPAGEFYIFDKDIKLRRERLAYLEKTDATHDCTEAHQIRDWTRAYAHFFTQAAENGRINDIDNPLLMLCPSTWKIIELINSLGLL